MAGRPSSENEIRPVWQLAIMDDLSAIAYKKYAYGFSSSTAHCKNIRIIGVFNIHLLSGARPYTGLKRFMKNTLK